MVPTLVEVWAPWCSTCRDVEPDVATAAAARAGKVRLERVDASTDPDRGRDLKVMATPTFIGFRDGAEVFRRTGRPTRADLDSMFDALAEGSQPPRMPRRTEAMLSSASGAVLLVAAVVTSSIVPLGVVGAGFLFVGVGLWLRGRSDD